MKGMVLRYSISVLSVATGLLFALLWQQTNETNFLLFVAAVMVSAWYGGLGAALLATTLAVLVSSFFLLPPLYTLNLADSEDVGHLGLFILVAVFISSLHQKVRSAQRRAEVLAGEREILLLREQEARVEAEVATRARDEFLAMVSHELRAPINTILGWSEILKLSGSSDKASFSKAIEAIERNSRNQSRLINDLLDSSRILAGKFHVDMHQIDLTNVVQAALEAVRQAADAKQIQLQVKSVAGVGLVSGDPNRLQQVMWNLLSNAIKFTPCGGHIKVQLQRVTSQLELAVSDTGIGIRPDFLPFVFDRFSQSDHTNVRRHEGLGLGLAIARQIVELHGGTIEAESPGAGLGSTFRIKLPAPTEEQ
jgi:signal transduction histidine kinase